MAEHLPPATPGPVDTRRLAPVVRTVAGMAVVSLVVACVGLGVVGAHWYEGAEALFRAGFIMAVGVFIERYGIGWTRHADAAEHVATATIESPVRTVWRVAAGLALVAAFLVALSLLFDGAETFFQMLSSVAGIFGWGVVACTAWERRTGRTLLSDRIAWFRRRGLRLVSVPTRPSATPATGAG